MPPKESDRQSIYPKKLQLPAIVPSQKTHNSQKTHLESTILNKYIASLDMKLPRVKIAKYLKRPPVKVTQLLYWFSLE